jgi:hypothetical protein
LAYSYSFLYVGLIIDYMYWLQFMDLPSVLYVAYMFPFHFP